MITPYSVLATSVDIPLFLSLVGPGYADRARPDSVIQLLLSDGSDAGRFTGVNPEPGPGFHQSLQPGADKLRPPARHVLGYCGVHHADRAERELQQSAGADLGQIEGGYANSDAHVKRAGQSQVL